MAVLTPIIDPDDLNQGIEVTINTTARTIALNVAGNLDNNGVTLQALYSFCKEEWRTDAALIKFPFPITAITPEQFEWIENWKPADDATRRLIRTAGWRENNAAGQTGREYSGVISLGNIDSTDPVTGDVVYYFFATDTSGTDFDFAGSVNQAVQTFGDAAIDATSTTFDKRGEVLTVRIRIQGKTFDQSTTTDIGVSTLTNQAYRFPLAEDTDLKINAALTDLVIDPNSDGDNSDSTDAGVAGMTTTFNAIAQSRTIGASSYDFGIIIEGNDAPAEDIYTYVQWALRQTTDINAGTPPVVVGRLADEMLQFIGDTLRTLSASNPAGGGTGVYIDTFNANDTNRLEFTDNTGTIRTFPFVAAGSLLPNANLQNDASAIYRMFFTSVPDGDFGTADAILVQDSTGTDIAGDISGSASISFDFAYDTNAQGSRTPGTDAPVTVVAIGLEQAQYVAQTATITRQTGLAISLVSALERNYSNPV